MKKYIFYILFLSTISVMAGGSWNVAGFYALNRSDFLDRVHQDYAFSRAKPDSGISIIRSGFGFQLGALYHLKERFPVISVPLSYSFFSASHPKPDFIDLRIHRIHLLPSLGYEVLQREKQCLNVHAGLLIGLHVFALNKYGQALRLEEDRDYQPAFFNWGFHAGLHLEQKLKRTSLFLLMRAEFFPMLNVGNYPAALLGTSYPWLKDPGLAYSFNLGVGFRIPWKEHPQPPFSSP